MVTQKEILEISERLKIQSFVIDKDWILSHFLNTMFHFKEVRKNFVFKGGTCLRKCYFEDYRFSEDLDFTLINAEFNVNVQFLEKIIKQAEINSGAKFHLKEIKSQVHNNIAQGYEITVVFWGADHKPNKKPLPPNRWQTKIKLDISFSEKVFLNPEIKNIYHSYTDSKLISNKVPVYPLKEIVAEKLRSLLQRNRPRDIYDLYYLSDIIQFSDNKDIYNLLKQKSEHKNVDCCKYNDFINQDKYKKNKRAWESSLEYHLPQGKLIDYDTAYSTTEKFIKQILKGQLILKKLISFTIKAEKGFLKKPDINEGIYLTYNMLHKPAILGILGAIIGLEGYKQNGVLPQYYKLLKDIPIGIKPIGDEKGNFQKTTITYNNTTGFASNEKGGNLIITEQTLIKPSYKIYLLLDMDNEYQNQLYDNIKSQKAEFLPYLGKNDYSLWWDKKDDVDEYEWETFKKKSNFSISTIFKKEEAIINHVAKTIGRKELAEKKNNFYYFERLPISFNEKLFQYNMADFAYSNVTLIDTVNINSNNLFVLKNKNEYEVVFLY